MYAYTVVSLETRWRRRSRICRSRLSIYRCKRFYPKRVLWLVFQWLCERSCKTTNKFLASWLNESHDLPGCARACARYRYKLRVRALRRRPAAWRASLVPRPHPLKEGGKVWCTKSKFLDRSSKCGTTNQITEKWRNWTGTGLCLCSK